MKKPSPNKSSKGKTKRKSQDSGASPARRSAPSPTVKQRQYVAGRLAGKSKKQSALDAGYGPGMAKNPGQKIDAKPAVEQLFTQLLTAAGATDELLAKRVFQGLNATAVLRETLYADREVLINFAERREMTELVLKLKGYLIDKHELRMVRTLEEILEASHEQ
jgi:hypothetical protein